MMNSLRPFLESAKSVVGLVVTAGGALITVVAWAVDVRNQAADNADKLVVVEKKLEGVAGNTQAIGEIKVKLDLLLDFESRQARREGGSRERDMRWATRQAKRRAAEEGIDAGTLEGM